MRELCGAVDVARVGVSTDAALTANVDLAAADRSVAAGRQAEDGITGRNQSAARTLPG